MAVQGGKGNTAGQMLDVLGCKGCKADSLNQEYGKLITLLTTQSGHPTVRVANGYFYDKNRITLKNDFRTVLEKDFDCIFSDKNFSDADAAKNQINDWVKEKTGGKIDGIVDNIGPLDVAFLINALYFKSDWAKGFNPEETHERSFLQRDGQRKQINFVSSDREVPYAITPDFSIADIPFKDSTFALSLVLPRTTDTKIDKTVYENLLSSLLYRRLYMAFPVMKLSYKNSLISSLKKLGMQEAFHPQLADFSAMGTAAANIYISQVQHKSVLSVDEKGAEGAAATSVGFATTSAPPSIVFDRPYYVVLRHIPTGTIVFAGYVAYSPAG
jgi:serpin B